MKNTVSKGVLFYLLVLLGIVLGVGCILIFILMFSPGTRIFGISYFKNNAQINLETFNVSEVLKDQSLDTYIRNGKITKIDIETNSVKVDLQNTDAIHFSFDLYSKTSGLSNSKKPKQENIMLYNYKYDEATGTFSIKVTDPNAMLYFNTDSCIRLNVPNNYNLSNINLSVKTDTGHISLGNYENNDFTFNSLTFDINNGSLFIPKSTKVSSSGEISIKSNNGTIETKALLSPSKFTIRAKSAKITLAEVGGLVDIKTESSTIKIQNVLNKLLYGSSSGIININTIGGDFECTEITSIANIFVNKVNGNVLIPKATGSNIEIGHIVGDAKIVTKNGSIKLGELNGDATLETDSGRITCLINNLKNSTSKITTVKGNIDARIKNLNGSLTINTVKGKVYFQYDNSQIFKLVYDCPKHKPNISQGITTGAYENSGTIAIGYNPDSTCANVVNITNNEGDSTFDKNLDKDYNVFA